MPQSFYYFFPSGRPFSQCFQLCVRCELLLASVIQCNNSTNETFACVLTGCWHTEPLTHSLTERVNENELPVKSSWLAEKNSLGGDDSVMLLLLMQLWGCQMLWLQPQPPHQQQQPPVLISPSAVCQTGNCCSIIRLAHTTHKHTHSQKNGEQKIAQVFHFSL